MPKGIRPTVNSSSLFKTLPFWIFYGLHVVGLIWTEAMDEGVFNLEVKASFIFLPLAFGLLEKSWWKHTRMIMWSFVAGVVIAGIVFLTRATYIYVYEDTWIQHFFGTRFCYTMHVGYYAIYLGLSALFVIFELLNRWYLVKLSVKFFYIILLIFLFGLLILTSAKNPIITFMLIALVIIGVSGIKKSPIWGTVALVGSIALFAFVIRNSEKTWLRFKAMYHAAYNYEIVKESTESSQVRKVAWKASADLITDNPVLGVGTGDDNNSMFDYYKNHGYLGAYRERINSHNQYLESGVKLGIPGILAVLFVLIWPIYQGILQRKELLIYSSLFFFLTAITESIFEVQAGVMVFCIIIPILMITSKNFHHDPILTTENSP